MSPHALPQEDLLQDLQLGKTGHIHQVTVLRDQQVPVRKVLRQPVRLQEVVVLPRPGPLRPLQLPGRVAVPIQDLPPAPVEAVVPTHGQVAAPAVAAVLIVLRAEAAAPIAGPAAARAEAVVLTVLQAEAVVLTVLQAGAAVRAVAAAVPIVLQAVVALQDLAPAVVVHQAPAVAVHPAGRLFH
jgi:hypothetical protein